MDGAFGFPDLDFHEGAMRMARIPSRGGLMKGGAGATLIELMIGMSISIVMMVAIAMAVQTQSRSSNRETARVDLTHNLQNAAIRMEKQLRMAGYQSGATSGMNVGAIATASLNAITFVYDTNDDTIRETIAFRPDNSVDAGYNASHPRLVKVDAAGISTIGSDITGVIFVYYGSDGITPTAVLDDIRNIKVTINGRSARINPDTGAYITGSLTFRVSPRNF
jgi:Tfp pilus assembly protein PilW